MRKEAISLVQTALENEAAFELTLNGVGTFGKPEQPRILWAEWHLNRDFLMFKQKVYQACLRCRIYAGF